MNTSDHIDIHFVILLAKKHTLTLHLQFLCMKQREFFTPLEVNFEF